MLTISLLDYLQSISIVISTSYALTLYQLISITVNKY